VYYTADVIILFIFQSIHVFTFAALPVSEPTMHYSTVR